MPVDNGAGPAFNRWSSIWVVVAVCGMDAFRFGTINVNSWPYLLTLDANATETFFGDTKTARNLGSILTAAIAGPCSNWFSSTRGALLFGQFVGIFSSVVYVLLELFAAQSRKFAFLGTELLAGISGGATGVWRVHLAMASTEKSRSRAISLAQLSILTGLTVGPIMVSVLTRVLGREGFALPWTTHFNLFTAPGYANLLTCVIGAELLLFHFDGRMMADAPKEEIGESGNTTSSTNTSRAHGELAGISIDRWAVVCCLLIRAAINFSFVYLITVEVPYAMMVFQWTPEQTSFIFSIVSTVKGFLGFACNLGFTFGILSKLAERKSIVVSLLLMLLFYFVSFPWPVYTKSIASQSVTLENGTRIGCREAFGWCADTPAVNEWLYLAATVLCLGIAMPFCEVNLDILYSKVLGPIKQGTMQGVFIVLGDCINVFGPILVSYTYTWAGPRPVYLFEMAYAGICLAAWMSLYRRMIPYSQRLANKDKHAETLSTPL